MSNKIKARRRMPFVVEAPPVEPMAWCALAAILIIKTRYMNLGWKWADLTPDNEIFMDTLPTEDAEIDVARIMRKGVR